MKPKILAHVVTFNHALTIKKCLESLLLQETESFELTILVSDNNSSDDTKDIINNNFSTLKVLDKELVTDFSSELDSSLKKSINAHSKTIILVENKQNFGFSKAHNKGFQYGLNLGFEYFLIVNPDCKLLPTCLNELYQSLKNENFAGTCCPQILRANENLEPLTPKQLDAAGMYITPAIRHLDRGLIATDNCEHPAYVFGASGALALYKKEFLLDIAFENFEVTPTSNTTRMESSNIEVFDNAFFAYREDADLSWRAQIAGWQCRYEPRAIAYHIRKVLPENRAALPKKLNWLGVRNRWLLLINNFSFLDCYHCLFQTSLRNLQVLVASLTIETSSFSANIDALKKLPQSLKHRKIIFSKRRASFLEINKWFNKAPYLEQALIEAPGFRNSTAVHKAFHIEQDIEHDIDTAMLDTAEIDKAEVISLLIINYNSGDRLQKLLRSLLESHLNDIPPNNNSLGTNNLSTKYQINICILDNHSSDQSLIQAREYLAQQDLNKRCADDYLTPERDSFKINALSIFLDPQEQNLGFSGGINFLVNKYPSHKFLILNPDIEIGISDICKMSEILNRFTNLGILAPTFISSKFVTTEGIVDKTNGAKTHNALQQTANSPARNKVQYAYCGRRLPSLGYTIFELCFVNKLFPNNPVNRSHFLRSNLNSNYKPLHKKCSTNFERYLEETHNDSSYPYIVQQPAAACILIKAELMELAQKFDEKFYPAWFEDVDFCKRAQKLGFLAAVTNQVTAFHEGGYSASGNHKKTFQKVFAQNRIRYWKKHGSSLQYFIVKNLTKINLLLKSLL